MFDFVLVVVFFFFKQKTSYDMRISDWSSDVCSSDLGEPAYGRANETFARPVGCQQRQQQALAVPRPVPVLIEAADDHAHRRLFDAGAAVGDHDIARLDRKSVVSGKGVSVRVDLGGRRTIKKKKKTKQSSTTGVTHK